jgi:hypothetical protein
MSWCDNGNYSTHRFVVGVSWVIASWVRSSTRRSCACNMRGVSNANTNIRSLTKWLCATCRRFAWKSKAFIIGSPVKHDQSIDWGIAYERCKPKNGLPASINKLQFNPAFSSENLHTQSSVLQFRVTRNLVGRRVSAEIAARESQLR